MLCLIFRKKLKWYIENFCYLVQFTDFFCLPACLSIVCNAQGTWMVEKDTNSLKCIKKYLFFCFRAVLLQAMLQKVQSPTQLASIISLLIIRLVYTYTPPPQISCSSTSLCLQVNIYSMQIFSAL